MKPFFCFSICILGWIFTTPSNAQNVLPDFSVRELAKGKIQVSWENPFPSCIQLAIQRSSDSSKNFRTLFSSQSPELPANGFVDNKPPTTAKTYYRIFYVLKGGDYYFSKVHFIETKIALPSEGKPIAAPVPKTEHLKEEKRAAELKKDMVSVYLKKIAIFRFTRSEYLHFRDSINTKTKDALHKINDHIIEWKPSLKSNKKELTIVYGPNGVLRELNKKSYLKFKDSIFTETKDSLIRLDEWHVQFKPFVPKPSEFITIFINNTYLLELEAGLYKKFKDSIALKTKDTLYVVGNNRADIHPFIPKYVWKPSVYVYTNAQGYVSISLPQVKQHRYHIIFYEEDGSELFRIKTVKESELVLDKVNFIHAGWFHFELFEDDKLKEKNKFQLFKE